MSINITETQDTFYCRPKHVKMVKLIGKAMRREGGQNPLVQPDPSLFSDQSYFARSLISWTQNIYGQPPICPEDNSRTTSGRSRIYRNSF